MTLEEYKRKTKDYLLNKKLEENSKSPYLTWDPLLNKRENKSKNPYLTRIEKESEIFFNDSWDPVVMVQAMISGLI